MLDTLRKQKIIIVIYNTLQEFIFIKIKNKMQKNSKDYQFCINVAIDNAKKRINLLDKADKKSVLEEYKEWINDDFNNNTVLVLREDPII